MELSRLTAENQWEKVRVTFPERQFKDAIDRLPEETPLGVGGFRLAGKGGDQKNKGEPVLAFLAESRPTDCASQLHRRTLDTGLFAYLALHTGDDIFIYIDLSAEPVALSVVVVVGALVAPNEENLLAVWREHIAQSC